MPRHVLLKAVRFGLGSVALLAGAACVSDNVVYRDRTLTTAPAAAAKFVGYSDVTAKTTVCGNCHVEQQAGWVGTKHASAWSDLQASGHATGACQACHTVSQLGNATTDSLVSSKITCSTARGGRSPRELNQQ